MECMDECIEPLGEPTTFSTLDTNPGLWEVEEGSKDRHKTAFACYHGLSIFNQIPFALNNALKTLQHAMDMILSPVKMEVCAGVPRCYGYNC